MRIRQSERWRERVEKNRYNINDFFQPLVREGRYGMPKLAPTNFIPETLFPYDERSKYKTDDGTIHFFIDDLEFEHVWLRASRYPHVPAVIEKAGSAITPDFSLYTDWPLAVQVWQTYRTRLLGCLWQSLGIEVIPSVSWSTRISYSFCFDGVPEESVVAIALMELGGSIAKHLFVQGFHEMMKTCRPTTILIYGEGMKLTISELEERYNTVKFKRYPSRRSMVGKNEKSEQERQAR